MALADSYDLVYIIKKKQVGEHSTLELEREGKPLKLEVTYQGAASNQPAKP